MNQPPIDDRTRAARRVIRLQSRHERIVRLEARLGAISGVAVFAGAAAVVARAAGLFDESVFPWRAAALTAGVCCLSVCALAITNGAKIRAHRAFHRAERAYLGKAAEL